MNDIVMRLQDDFRAIAFRIAGSADRDIIGDLVQEMSLAVLRCPPDKTDSYYRDRAKWRARDYLRRELRAKRNERLPHQEDERRGENERRGIGVVADAYDQDGDFLAANLGWD